MGLDHARQLKQVMPVASVAGEARCVEAQHGSDFAGTQPGDQAFEARARHRPACRSAEIVVDHLDLVEAAAASKINQFVLAPSALGMCLHRRLGRLTDVDRDFAPCTSAGISSAPVIGRLRRHRVDGFDQQAREQRDHFAPFVRA